MAGSECGKADHVAACACACETQPGQDAQPFIRFVGTARAKPAAAESNLLSLHHIRILHTGDNNDTIPACHQRLTTSAPG